MKEKLITFSKNHKNLMLFLASAFLLLFFSVFFIIYNSDSNISKRSLKHIANDLNNINSNLESGIKDLTIDTNKSYEVLTTSSGELKKLLTSISEIKETNEEISSIKSDLNNAIDSTIALYDNCIYILSNLNSIKSSDDLNTFLTAKEKCVQSYSILSAHNVNINFSKKSLLFFENTYNYLNTIIKINRDSEFQNKQQREFFFQLESFNSDFNKLNEDLMIAINKIREDKRDLQAVIDDIYNKEHIYEEIQSKSVSISIPDGYMNVYESLNEYLNLYGIYLKSIKEAVIYEKTCSDIDKYSEEINKNYKNASSKRDDVLKAYSAYKSNF